jgi:hypothetical protein
VSSRAASSQCTQRAAERSVVARTTSGESAVSSRAPRVAHVCYVVAAHAARR